MKNQDMYDIEFFNIHDKIYEDNLAMTCREMELTEEFLKKDNEYLNNSKYNIIECGYINVRRR